MTEAATTSPSSLEWLDGPPPVRSWASSPGVRRSMMSNTSKDTGPELLLLDALRAAGLSFAAHAHPVLGLRRRADAVFARARLAVFMDGCFWHRCPEHWRGVVTNAPYWEPKLERNWERDRETDAALRMEHGYEVVRVWEHELKSADGLAAAVARIRDVVLRRTGGAGEYEGPDTGAAQAGGGG